jgi:hypothetical protein
LELLVKTRTRNAAWALRWACLVLLAALAGLFPVRALHAQATQAATTPSGNADTTEPASGQTSSAVPLARGKKLVLTDGSFQIVREYQRQGDRVRYFSTERAEWEEIPDSLVDWPATEKANAEIAASQEATLEKIHAAVATEIATSLDTGSSLLVGPGVFLPDQAGFYILDGKSVHALEQSQSDSRLDKGRAILKGISGVPLISTKRFIEVPGKRAKIRVQGGEPEFYFRTADGRNPLLTLVRADVSGDKRHLATAVIDVVGQTKYEQHEIPILASEAAHGVQRVTISQELEPGEYALLETTPEGVNSYVWDFGVDGSSGAGAQSNRKASGPATSKSKAK